MPARALSSARSLSRAVLLLAPLGLLLASSCGGTRGLALAVEAEPDIVARGVVVEVSLLRGGCGSTDVVYEARAQLASPGRLPLPPALEAGRWALSARVRDASCTYFAEGCAEIQLPSDREALSVALVETDLREAACPATECSAGLCAGIDVDPPMGPAVPRTIAPPPLASTGTALRPGPLRPEFSWARTPEVVEYELSISARCTGPGVAQCAFGSGTTSFRTTATTFRPDAPITAVGGRFAWRLRGCDASETCSAWSEARLLDVGRDSGDLDDDGLADVVVGAIGSGSEGVVLVSRGDDPTSFDELARSSSGGYGRVITVADSDGDGRSEIYVGEALADVSGMLDSGRVVRIRDGVSTDVSLGTPVPGAAAGSAIVMVGDVDGDGYRDLAVGAPQQDVVGERAGAVIFLRGGPSGFSTPVTLVAPEPQAGARFGEALAGGDVDGDGHADLIVGEPRRTPTLGLEEAGAVYLFRGGPSGLAAGRAITIDGARRARARLGSALTVPGDLDGDGREDLVVGAPTDASDGSVHLLPGSDMGPLPPGVTLPAPGGAGGRFGATLSGPGDLDGDGLGDFIVGAPEDADGAAYLYLGAMGGPALVPTRVLDATADIGGSLATAGDVDGDGRDDVALVSSSAGLALHRGEAMGLPSVPTRTMAAPSGLTLVAVATRGR